MDSKLKIGIFNTKAYYCLVCLVKKKKKKSYAVYCQFLMSDTERRVIYVSTLPLSVLSNVLAVLNFSVCSLASAVI